MNVAKLHVVTGTLCGCLYAIGGFVGNGLISDTVSKYDPIEDKWIEVKSMHHRKPDISVAVLNGFLYAVGGRSETYPNHSRRNSIERYDPGKNEWQVLKPTNDNIYHNGLKYYSACAAFKGLLYVMGAKVFDLTIDSYTTHIQMYGVQ